MTAVERVANKRHYLARSYAYLDGSKDQVAVSYMRACSIEFD